MSLYDSAINRVSPTDPKQMSNRYRNVATGTMFDLQIRTTVLIATTPNEDGSETRTALSDEQATNVFTAWCKQKEQDGQFTVTLNQALVKAGSSLATMQVTRVIGDQKPEEVQIRLQNEVMRLFLGCFPQIPNKFMLNGTKYELTTTTERYYAKQWIIPPEGAKIPMIRMDKVTKRSELGYYYDPELVNRYWAEFKNRHQIIVVPRTGNGLPALMVGGKPVIYYIPAADVSTEGSRNILSW